MNITVVQDQFSCPICLDILKNPVTIPCGHSYCMTCITACWDLNRGKHAISCPQCRESFNTRPVLNKNVMMDTLVEKLRTTNKQHSTSNETYAQPNDEACDFCVGKKRKAMKSCLSCVASFCEAHLQSHHLQYPALKKHTLVDANTRLKSKMCVFHGKILDIYCQLDRECICYMCTVTFHRGHDLVSAEIERKKQQKQLMATQQKHQKKVQERERQVKDLIGAEKDFRSCAQVAVQDTETLFAEMIDLLNRRCRELKEEIRAQEEFEVCKAKSLLFALEQEVCELKKRDAELEQLARSDDHIHFLKNFKFLKGPTKSKDLPHHISVNLQISFDNVKHSLSKLKNHLRYNTKEELNKIAKRVKDIHVVLPPRPESP